jgi:hypothetical protein
MMIPGLVGMSLGDVQLQDGQVVKNAEVNRWRLGGTLFQEILNPTTEPEEDIFILRAWPLPQSNPARCTYRKLVDYTCPSRIMEI